MAIIASDTHRTPTRTVGDVEQHGAAELDRLVAAFVRIRGVDRLEGALITRHWLAADMGVSIESLDGLLRLFRWQGLIGLPNEHLVTVEDHEAMRALALGLPAPVRDVRHDDEDGQGSTSAIPVWAGIASWH